jgi:hypothetical protein
MIKIISKANIIKINATALEVMTLIKATKFFFTSEYNADDRINASCEFFYLNDVIKGSRGLSIITEKASDLKKLKSLITKLYALVGNQRKFTLAKIKDYAGDIKPKLCRELVSDLEDLYILGDINMADIEDVYAALNKPLPKKFAKTEMSSAAKIINSAISKAIREDAQRIRINSIAHYNKMVELIDPSGDFDTVSEFFFAGRKKISDMGTLRLCMACKFDNKRFMKLIDENFDACVNYAASKVAEYHREDSKPVVKVNSTKVGGKGFDVELSLNGRSMYVRAIPVEGYYVRFHYRYIIT